ncbi:MAG: hypothetical protein K5925_05160 [Bacilli bacterium]|nr:hypothetical protein [Bacilli bacterium]
MAKATKKQLFYKYLDKVSSLNKDKTFDDIYLSFLKGKNSFLRYHRYESSLFDSSWIDVVEDCLYDLGEIVNNPKQVTKQESNVVPVELAKKIDGESVQHLASHTQYIKEVDEQNNVVPSKILSHSNEDNMNTYENRFIATFIRRLVLFVEKRYEYIQRMIPLHMEEVMYLKTNTQVGGEEVEIETKIRVKKETDDDIAIKSQGYIDRILKMREYIFYYYNSPFMKKLKNERDVRKPILQTNIIRKNPKYHHCYKTLLFIERFSSLGVNYKVDEAYKNFTDEDLAELNYLFLTEYLSLKTETEMKDIKTVSKTHKPKVMTSIDDEIFTFGEPLTGTLEFVRVDEEYRKYLDNLGHLGLPLHPDKYEKLYYQGEYKLKATRKKELQEIEKLLRRKIRENDNWEKYVQELLKVFAEEDRAEEEKRLMAIANEELARIEKKRQELIAAAKGEKQIVKEQAKKDKEAKKQKYKVQKEKQKPVEEPAPQEQPQNQSEEQPLPVEPVINEPVEKTEEVAPKEEKKRGRKKKEAPVENKPDEPILSKPQKEEQVEENKEIESVNNEPQEESILEEQPSENEQVQEENVSEEPAKEEQPQQEEEQPAPEVEEPQEEVQESPIGEKQPSEVQEEPLNEESNAQVEDTSAEEETSLEEQPVDGQPQQEESAQEEASNDVLSEEQIQEQPVEEEVLSEEQPQEENIDEEPSQEKPQEENSVIEENNGEDVQPQEEQPVEEGIQPEEEKVEEQPVEEVPTQEDNPQEEVAEEEQPQNEMWVKNDEPQQEESNDEQSQEQGPINEEVNASNDDVLEDNEEKEGNSSPMEKEEKTASETTKKERKPREKVKEEPIPGRFIVKTLSGYYVSKDNFSEMKEDAHVFDDYNLAKKIKKELGGKIVKL